MREIERYFRGDEFRKIKKELKDINSVPGKYKLPENGKQNYPP